MRIIVIGCGRLGCGLAQALSRRGHAVTVVDRDPAAFRPLGGAFSGSAVAGQAFDRDTLVGAGIERADALAAATASDDVNLVVARAARLIFRVPKVVARLYDPRKADAYRRLGVQTVATTTWGVNRAVEMLSYSDLDSVVSLGASVDVVDVEVPPALGGRPVAALSAPGEFQVVAVSRAGATFLPTGESRFAEGDVAHVALLTTSAGRLRELLGRSGGVR